MSQRQSSNKPFDVIGVGFGPSNLALAIALEEQAETAGRRANSLFLDRQTDYHWHGDTLVSQSELQISFLKDLVTLRNPTSRHSFVNYLQQHGRLIDFINLGTFYPCRMEYSDYLRWVAGHFREQCAYGNRVDRVEPVIGMDGSVELLDVVSVDSQGREHRRRTRSVVVGTGGTPRIPAVFRDLRDDDRVFHHSRYLSRITQQRCARGEPMRIAVVGGGQSAAEAFIDLNDSYPNVKVDLILRSEVLKPADDSPFVNQIFAPENTHLFFDQPEPERERLISEFHNTNYSVVDLNLIEQIYAILYRQKVSKRERHAFRCRTQVQSATSGEHGVRLHLRDVATGQEEVQHYDAVILATGYERTSHKTLLAPLADYLGDFDVERSYRVRATPNLKAGVFVQGFSEANHGLSDTLLSVLPARAWEISEALLEMAESCEHEHLQLLDTALSASA
ncbi:SidA/IucD/PvdA family monooxygenase [Pseudomonas sp. P5_152]|jgi:L-ornithine N5-oxygenase|uniref:lysine N(6)-hydroxylase/L-ornithine N(5)-oxygenase family protein n=1 Tax=unclassified Pseudomonas TaxID=196821 RepID=UPI000BA430DE|nr:MULTISPECIES: SidA/IucD/PvdA family monooxygenase [unclassified Pseudomonas]MDX9668505.1 SidA/IucD/PvdA family monooxygenase [Pseudomonas sp. P5_152]QHD01248.1 ornithine monooxygenase [Pseudomonas sp. S04]QHF33732.1 ornithine monooxygenase [Pseudomonas sp. S19]